VWNFATNNATANIYVCESDATGCGINSTQYIPSIDNICVDFRTRTFEQQVNAQGIIEYNGPYAIEDQPETKYWYPVVVLDAGNAEHIRYKLGTPTSLDTCMLTDNDVDDYAYPLFASKYIITSQMMCVNND